MQKYDKDLLQQSAIIISSDIEDLASNNPLSWIHINSSARSAQQTSLPVFINTFLNK